MADTKQPAAETSDARAPLLDDIAFLHRLLAASPDCIKVLDLDANLLSINEAGRRALEIADVTPHLGSCWTGWWTTSARDAALAAVALARTGGTGRFEAAAHTFGGTPKRWDVTVTAIPGPDGNPERLLSVSRDITATRQAHDAAAERLDQLQSVVEGATDYAVISVDPDARIIGWSTGAAKTFGYTQEAAIGEPFDLIWTPDDRASGSPTRELLRAKELGVASDDRWHERADGRRIYVRGATRPIRNAAGELTGFVKVCRDETQDRASEQELVAARRRSDSALLAGEVGTFNWDIKADRLYGDENFARLFGIPLDPTGAAPLAAYVAAIHPDDRATTLAKVEHTIRTGEPYQAEYRILAGGRERWVVARGQIERDDTGQPVRFPGVVVDITDRRRAEQALADTRQRLDAALVTGQIATWVWDLQTDRLHGDQNMSRFFRLPPHDGHGLPVATYFNTLHPDDLPEVMAAIDRAIKTGEDYVAEYRIVTFDPHRWAYARARVEHDDQGRPVRLAGVVMDVTERKHAETAKIASDARYRTLIDTIDQGFCVIEVIFNEARMPIDYWFVEVNPAFERQTGLRNAIGRRIRELAPDIEERWFQTYGDVVTTGQPARFEMESSALQRWFEVHASSVGEQRPNRVAILFKDITDRKRAEAERQELLGSERAARGDAERASRMKDDFLATLSHELRTPLNAIVGWTQILKSSLENPEDLLEGLAVIERNARAQTQIIEDILDMSRIVSGKLRLDVQQIDLASLVRAGVETVQPAADAKSVRIQRLLDPHAGPVMGDPNRLHQVFWNLLSNAVKFTPRDGRIQVRLERVNSHVEVSVIDTGEGIAADFLPHVFDRFRQADGSTTRQHGGLGLGLAIVKQLVELHGGSVRVKSPGPGRGSTFIVALPIMAANQQSDVQSTASNRQHPKAETAIKGHASVRRELAGLSVIVVDDEPDARTVVKRLLVECGAVVRAAGSVAEALALFRQQPPDVLISDIGMPGEDGYALIREVRSLPATAGGDVQAVALTAYARAADRVRALEAGFTMHLAKPIEPVELIVTVASLARRGAGAHGANPST